MYNQNDSERVHDSEPTSHHCLSLSFRLQLTSSFKTLVIYIDPIAVYFAVSFFKILFISPGLEFERATKEKKVL